MLSPSLHRELTRMVNLDGTTFKLPLEVSGQLKRLGYVTHKQGKWAITEMGRAALRAHDSSKKDK